jgi:uncharacterized lipoprotein
MNISRFASLDEAVGSLPRDVRSARDLWPQIANEIDARAHAAPPRSARMPWPIAVAASLAVASLAGALYWSVTREHATAALLAEQHALTRGAAGIPVDFQPPQDTQYAAARAALERTFNERLDLLAPATRDRVRADLETIRKANADISAALAQDPASPLLWQLLRNTWQQEINLYTSVAQTTQTMLTRSSRS